MNKLLIKIVFITVAIFFSSCGGDSSPGYEYMPNMYRSPSIETYGEHNIKNFDGLPVKGTVSRGNLVTFNYDKSLSGEDGAFYRGRVDVPVSELTGLPSEFKLTSGMTASADMKVGERLIITYLLNPIIKGLSLAFREPD